MGKNVYKIVDNRGRIYMPAESRKAAGIEPGDIVRLDAAHGQLTAHRVELIELGDKSTDTLAAYITAGVPYLTDTQLRDVIAHVLEQLNKHDVTTEEK